MKTPPLALLLGSLVLNAGCSSCAKKPDQSTTPPEAPTAMIRTVLPSKATVTTVVFTTDDKLLFWMETINGTHSATPDTSFWTGEGIVIPENGAFRHYLADGTNFVTASAPTEGITPISEVLKMETQPPEGYAWEADTGSSGLSKVFINPALGKRQRIGMFTSEPTPVWLEGTRTAPRGTAVPALSVASGFMNREGTKLFRNEPPVGSTPVPAAALSAEELAAWGATFAEMRGTEISVDLTQMINLDSDEALEGFVCIAGGRGNPCYIVDQVGTETRFYSTTIQWFTGDAEPPQFFSVENNGYIMHSPELATTNRGNGIIRIVRFDGSGYTTEAIQ